jgi:hypothetical protein
MGWRARSQAPKSAHAALGDAVLALVQRLLNHVTGLRRTAPRHAAPRPLL